MKKNTLLYIVFIIGMMNANAQKSTIARGDKEYEQYAYVDAIETYEKAFTRGHKSVDMLQKIANSYYFRADLDNAAKWYGELFSFTAELETEYYYRYAQSLKSIKEYDKADKIMAKFSQLNENDRRAKLAANQKNYLEVIRKNSGRYDIQDAGINTEYSDYGASFFGDKVVFASSRSNNKVFEKKSPWTGEGYTNLYAAFKNQDGSLSEVENLSSKINSKYNESTLVLTKNEETLYFTRNNYLKKKGKDDSGTILMKIYRASFKDGKWGDVTELPFNSDSYNVAHPALSSDEKYLYFSSDMPGTLGQSDIFRVIINYDGTFGPPENLGNVVNTEGRETFPFVSAENELYFSSDGHPGLGGLDVFVFRVDNKWYKEVFNLGESLNSPKDDFGYAINVFTRLGYFSSNREGGKGGDDIYRFRELRKLKYPCDQSLAGQVTDKNTGQILVGAKVTLFDVKYNKLVKVASSDKEGKYDFGPIDCDTQYLIKAEKKGYTPIEVTMNIENESGKTFVPLMLEKIIIEVKLGDDLAKVLELEPIYFDLNKSDIRPDAALELAKVLEIMQQNPNIVVDVRSHTDSRNSADYNKKLSDRRAKSTMAWLIKNGIDKSRLSAKGYGESQLLNKCKDGVKCTEEQHQENRRSEFIIIK